MEGAVEVSSDPSQPWLGKFLRATRAASPGQRLLRERYLTFVCLPGDLEGWKRHTELYRAVVEGACAPHQLEGSGWGRWGAGLEQIRAAGLFAGDDALALRFREEILAAGEAAASLSEEVLEDMVYLACVFDRNGFASEGASGWSDHLLFQTLSRANHSCAPNAVVFPADNPTETLLVALQPLSPGAMVNICYLSGEKLIKPTPQRLQAIHQAWGFDCCCGRCIESPDKNRRLEVLRSCCSSCGAPEFAASSPAGKKRLTCTACGKEMHDAALAAELLDEETAVEELLASLPEPEDLRLPAEDDFAGMSAAGVQRCLTFAAVHPRHHAAAEVSRRQVAALHAAGRFEEAAAAQQDFVDAVRELLPDGLRGLAWLGEIHGRLAFVKELAGCRKEARKALEDVLDNLELASGMRPPVQMLSSMIPCPEWFRLLQDVAPELNRAY